MGVIMLPGAWGPSGGKTILGGDGGGGALGGDVVGPASATDDALARWDGETGKLVKDSVVQLSDAGVLSGLTQINVDNLQLDGNTLSSTSGNINVLPFTGGDFQFDSNGLRMGSSATDFVEVGHGGTHGFIEHGGAGDLEFRFDGVDTAAFRDDGHLHLISMANLRHTLRIKSNTNANDAGVAWQNSGSSYTGAIYRKDATANRADMFWAVGLDADVVNLVDAFVIRGGSGVEGEVEFFVSLQVDNLKIDGNSISAVDTDGSVTIIPNGVGKVAIIGDFVVAGNVKNQGPVLIETKAETVLYSAGYAVRNADHVATSGKTAGRVDVNLADALNDTITAGVFTPGVASTSNPTVATIGAATFAQGTFVLFKDTGDNDGLYEVESHAANLLTVRGVGTVGAVEDFTRDQFEAATDTGTIRKVNVSVHRTSLTGTNEHGKGDTTPITFHQLAHADDVPIVFNEFFDAKDANFFGELGVPGAQGWTDTATGTTTIDLVTETVFGVSQQVVRHNDNFGDGLTTSLIALDAADWVNIDNFGASFGGVSRMDSVDGFNGFFAGFQANAAENPDATGNRRYGINFANNGGFLEVDSPDVSSPTLMDGTGGNPLIPFDQYFKWECVIPAGLGAAEFFVNGILTTHTVSFVNNSGGLGTRIIIGSGSTGGVDRIAYHARCGATIYQEGDAKTLSVAAMEADVANIFTPPGRRNYTVTLPDGNPRPLGSTIELVSGNVGGTVTLQTQVPATPESLFDGLRTIVIDVPKNQNVTGTNVIDNGNVYNFTFPAPLTISGQWSDPTAQKPTVTTPVVVLFRSIDLTQEGVAHSATDLTGEFTALVKDRFFWIFIPQWERTTSGGTRILEWWVEIDVGAGFVRVPKSAILERATSNASGLATLNLVADMEIGDKIRFMMRVESTSDGLGLFTSADDGTRPEVPAAILTCVRGR